MELTAKTEILMGVSTKAKVTSPSAVKQMYNFAKKRVAIAADTMSGVADYIETIKTCVDETREDHPDYPAILDAYNEALDEAGVQYEDLIKDMSAMSRFITRFGEVLGI